MGSISVLDAARTTRLPPTGAGIDPTLETLLEAARRLAGAGTASLFEAHHEMGVVRRLAGVPFDETIFAGMPIPERRGAIPALARAAPHRWLSNVAVHGSDGLLTVLHESTAATTCLLLTPRTASAAARAALERQIADLSIMLSQHLDKMRQLHAAEEARDAAREALDHCECGLVVVRADHSVVFANSAGLLHLDSERALHVRRGVLRPVDHGKAIRFEAALDGVIAARTGDRRARASVMLLGRRDEGDATVIAIAPAERPGEGGAAAMVYLLCPAREVRRGLDALCQLQGLSRVEGNLIAHLMDGLTISEAAVRMNVKIDTARTYLKQIFLKIGVRRQSDLVSLMTRYLRATRGDFEFVAS